MRTTDEQVSEVLRRASLLRERSLRRKKILLGIPAGLGVDALIRRWKRRRIDRYAQKWLGPENPSRPSCER